MRTEKKFEQESDFAVVLVHGIGDIAPGDVLDSSIKALERHLEIENVSPPSPFTGRDAAHDTAGATVRRAEYQHASRRIDLVEFNWTGVVGKIRLYRPVDAFAKLLALLREVPALGGIGRATRWDRGFLALSSWLFQAAVIVVLLTGFATAAHELARHEVYTRAMNEVEQRQEASPTTSSEEAAARGLEVADAMISVFESQDAALPTAAPRVIFTALMVVVSWIFVIAFYALFRLLKGLQVRRAILVLSSSAIGCVLALLGMLSAALTGILAFQLGLAVLDPSTSIVERLGYALSTALLLWVFAKIVSVLANLVRDVVHYLAPDRHGEATPNQRAVREQLWALLQDLREEGRYTRLVLIAHSLGSVVLVDLLRDRASSESTVDALPIDIVTAGSPLRRLIYRFFPDRSPNLASLRDQLAHASCFQLRRWFNVYRVADYVGQALTRSAFLLDIVGWRWSRDDASSSIEDHLLTPRYLWPFAHANYWGDARFLRFVALNVIQPRLDAEPAAHVPP